MTLQVLPFITYVFTVTFTPGPNNISSAGFGMEQGYVKTLPYLLGIFCGFFLVMLGTAAASDALANVVPELLPVLKYTGAAYIAWLAWHFAKKAFSSENFGRERGRKSAFVQGLILQVVNIKVLIYGLTVFTLFINPVYENIFILMLFSLFLAGCSFVSISLWTAIGGSLNRFFSNSPIKRGFFLVSSLLLLYSAAAALLPQR